MPPVTGEPQLGGEEAPDTANHEEGRPPDEIFEDDRMDTSSRRFPSPSMSKSTEIFDKDSEQLGPFASRKGKRKLDYEGTHRHIPDEFETEDEDIVADARDPGPSDPTEPHDDSKYRDNLPQTRIVDIWADSLAETRALDRMEMGEKKLSKWQHGKSEHTLQQQRSWLVHGIWASIENVRKISRSLLVNKPQCEHIAGHFEVTGDVLQKLGLGKDFVPGQVLEGGSGIQSNLAFDKMHFRRMAKTFEEHLYERDSPTKTIWSKCKKYIRKLLRMDGSNEDVQSEIKEGGGGIQSNLTFDATLFNHIAGTFEEHFDELDSLLTTDKRDWSRKFEENVGGLPAMDGSSEESLSVHSKINEGLQDYTLRRRSLKEKFLARSGYRVQHRLDGFLCFLFGVLKHGEDLVLFHSGLEEANNGVVERTGMSGEKFVQIHELLYKLLDCYTCLEHCEGTEFASGYLSRLDVCGAESILYYLNSNLLPKSASLFISDNFLNIEMATRISELLKRPNCALKTLSIESFPGVEVDQEELCKYRLMIIEALSESVGLTSLTLRGSNGKEVHEFCKSPRAIRVLENLVISTDGPLADNDAMDLSAMLKEDHSLKTFILEFDDVSLEGVVYLGAMLAEISIDEFHLRSKGFSRVHLKCFLGLLMAYIDGKRNVTLSLEDHHFFLNIWRSSFEGGKLPTGESGNTQKEKFCIQKTLNRFSIKFTDLDTDAVCEILHSLKKNKTLQVLELEYWPSYSQSLDDNREVAACLEALLAESVGLTSLTLRGWNGKEVHELCKSLRANRVLEKLVMSTDGPLADNDAMDLSAMLKENHNLRTFTLEYEGRKLSTGESHNTQKELFCIEKTLNLFSIKFTDLATDAVCEILHSLKKNKTLQVLELEYWPSYSQSLGDNREVAACLEALLAENTGLRDLKVQFHAWDKCFVQHLLRPLTAKKDGEPKVNNSLKQLHIVFPLHNYLDSGTISNANFSRSEQDEVVKSIARMLRTNKTLCHFAIDACLGTCDICEIVDSLKTNTALQVLRFEQWKVFNDPQVKVACIDLLVNYNFTLSMIKTPGFLSLGMDIETFMKEELVLDTKVAPSELWSPVCTSSDSPIVDSVHDLEQAVGTLQLEKGEGSTKEVCGSSKRAIDKQKLEVEAKDERPRLFLSYSKEMKDFALPLCKALKLSNYNVVEQDSINLGEVVDQCQLAIVVLSDMYVKSKLLMSELCTIVKSKKINNPILKVYPLFYKLTLQDLQSTYISTSSFGGGGISLDIALEKEALNFLCEGKIEVWKKANYLVDNLIQKEVDVGKFCDEFSELQRSSWPSNGLEFGKNAISEEGYVHAILEEISHYMPAVEECNNDQIWRHPGKLEMESKLSVRQMKSLLESLASTNFYLLRMFNMAQSLQEKYIQYSSFEEMCLHLSPEQKDEYNKGRIAAALFPTTFLYYLKAHMFQGPHGGNFRPMLKAASTFVGQKMQKECNQKGVQISIFSEFVDTGPPLDPKRTIAMCENFPAKTLDGSKQLFIVQDDLTGAYYSQRVEALDFGTSAIDADIGVIGVIGVKVTSTEIQVEIMWEDGSYYLGALEDFSYDLELDNNKQCALEAFGDLEGARFLSENRGIKCSPLLIIALAMAIDKKGLTLTWSDGKGHIQSNSILPAVQLMEFEVLECQILYGGHINQLGEAMEWGMNQFNQNCTSSNDTSIDTLTSNKCNDTSSHTLRNVDLSSIVAKFNAGAQNYKNWSIAIKVPGFGVQFGFDKQNCKGKKIMDQSFEKMQEFYWEERGGYVIGNRNDRHKSLEENLFQGSLYAERDLNYFVVCDSHTASHVSIYYVNERSGERRLELEWITDFFIKEGPERIKSIFKDLKGETLEVTRTGTEYLETTSQQESKGIMKRFKNLLSNKGSCKDNKLEMVCVFGRSNKEWEHIVGLQPDIDSKVYWWNASYTQAITYSRTRYSSGVLLSTHAIEKKKDSTQGTCSRKFIPNESTQGTCCRNSIHNGSDYVQYSQVVKSCGKFSKPPQSLSSKWHGKIHWGGFQKP